MKTVLISSFRSGTLVIGVAAVLLTVLATPIVAAAEDLSDACAVLDIDGIGWEGLAAIQNDPDLDWWVEFGSEMVVCGDATTLDSLGRRIVRTLDPSLAAGELWLSRGWEPADLEKHDIEVVAGGGRFVVARAREPQVIGLRQAAGFDAESGNYRIESLDPNVVVVRQAVNFPPRQTPKASNGVQFLVDQVDGARWFADIVTLASYNRYTHASDIHNARDWLVQQFESLPGLTVTTPSFMVQSTVAYNVIATLAGTTTPDDWYIIGGHYDATSQDPFVSAPGAEDNASGCAGVLETARIFTTYPPEATMLFICYSGEEQGLYGSEAHVADLFASGDHDKVQMMLDMDMIGYTSDSDLDCLLETDPFADFLVFDFADAAALYTTLRIEMDFFAGGSDHVPYLDSGIPALLTIENDWWQYPYYHTTNDLPVHITIEMGEEILKMNVAAMAVKVGAETTIVFADGFESGDVSAWSTAVP